MSTNLFENWTSFCEKPCYLCHEPLVSEVKELASAIVYNGSWAHSTCENRAKHQLADAMKRARFELAINEYILMNNTRLEESQY